MAIVSQVGGLWADLLDPIVQFRADQAFNRRPSMIDRLFNVQGSSRAYEAISGVGAIGIDAWEEYYNTGRIPEVDFDQGYKKTYTHREYLVDLGFEKKTVDDAQDNQVFRFGDRIGDSAAVFREVQAASVFNNAFSASYVGADGVALCSDSHPLSPMKTGVTQDNNFALQLNLDNVETVRQAMMALTDDNNNKMAVMPTTLLVPPALGNQARIIAGSQLDPTNANNALNPQAGRWTVLEWHYLTSSTKWFMIDEMLMKQSLDWFNRDPFSVYIRGGDDMSVRAYWRSKMRFSYGFSDWKWIAGSGA